MEVFIHKEFPSHSKAAVSSISLHMVSGDESVPLNYPVRGRSRAKIGGHFVTCASRNGTVVILHRSVFHEPLLSLPSYSTLPEYTTNNYHLLRMF